MHMIGGCNFVILLCKEVDGHMYFVLRHSKSLAHSHILLLIVRHTEIHFSFEKNA